MLKGTRDGILKRVQPVSIHGQVSWDVFFTDVEDPDGQIHVARIGPEAVASNLEPGDRIRSSISSASPVKSDARRSDSVTDSAGFVLPSAAVSAVRSRDRLADSIRVFGVSPVRGAASIASTTAIPSTTRPNAV